MSKKSVPFRAHAGQPLTIDVTGTDGKPYVLSITLAIFDVADTGERVPVPGGTDTMPKFEFRVQLATETRPKTS